MEEGEGEMEEEIKGSSQLGEAEIMKELGGIIEVLKHKVKKTCFMLLVDV